MFKPQFVIGAGKSIKWVCANYGLACFLVRPFIIMAFTSPPEQLT